MTNNSITSQRNHNKNTINNATNGANNVVSQSEQNQPIPYSGTNNEVVVAVNQPNNTIIATRCEDLVCLQIHTSNIKTTLSQNNVKTTANTPPFFTRRSQGMLIRKYAGGQLPRMATNIKVQGQRPYPVSKDGND